MTKPMSLSQRPIKVTLKEIFRKEFHIEVTYSDLDGKNYTVLFYEKADSVSMSAGKIFYSRDQETWAFTPTHPFAIAKRICQSSTPDKINQPSVIIRDTNFHCRLYPISLSGRHFACIKKNALYYFEITADDNLEQLFFPNLEVKRAIIVMLSHEQKTFAVIGEYEAKIFQFSKNKIDEIKHIKFQPHTNENQDWMHLKNSVTLQENRYVLLTGPQPRLSSKHFLLLDLEKASYQWLIPNGYHYFAYEPYTFATFSSPYIIIFSFRHIAVFNTKNIHKPDFFKIPDEKFYFPQTRDYEPCHVVAWPYDQERGQLWAIALKDHFSIKLILVKFKEGCDLEKIRDIDVIDHTEPFSMFLVNNLLYYHKIGSIKKDCKNPEGHSAQLLAYNPETDSISVINPDDNPYKISMLGSHLGIIAEDSLQTCLTPFPESKKSLTETEIIADTCRMFSMDLVHLIASFLSPAEFPLGKSVPPAEIKRSAKEQGVLDKLDFFLAETKDDKKVNNILRNLKTKLLCDIGYRREIINEAVLAPSLSKAKTGWFKMFRPKVQTRYQISQFLDEAWRECDELDKTERKKQP